jgi:glycosyltransferase involved in cell wall biosynthesis
LTLAAVVLTLNEEANIGDCLASLRWTDTQVVFDSYSVDRTVPLSVAAGATVIQHPFVNYAEQRNAAIDRVSADWLFFVDADERATPDVAAEVQHVIAEAPQVGWSVPRHNYIFGRLTLGCGWYPDYQFRLFRHGRARWERAVHEVAIVDGAQGKLENPLIHYNYDDLRDFTTRQVRYCAIDARVLREEGVHPRFYTPATQAVRHFWWRFADLKGFRDGLHGLRLCALLAYYEARKYGELRRLWRSGEAAGRGATRGAPIDGGGRSSVTRPARKANTPRKTS